MDEETKMNTELDIWVKISQQIGELSASVKMVLSKLTEHEHRLDVLEKTDMSGNGSIKDNIVKWLVIALVGSISVIVTLTGAGAILKQLLGAN